MQPEELTLTLVQSLVENAQRLGLTWEIVYATVVDGSDPAATTVVFDNPSDVTTIVPVISVIGRTFTDQRVCVISVPPAGKYIVGVLNEGVHGMEFVDADSTVGTPGGAFTAETVVLTLASKVWKANTAYFIDISLDMQTSVNTNAAVWRVRDSALGGTLYGAGVWPLRNVASNSSVANLVIVNRDTADVTKTTVFTLERAGAGTITVGGSATTVAWFRRWKMTSANDPSVVLAISL